MYSPIGHGTAIVDLADAHSVPAGHWLHADWPPAHVHATAVAVADNPGPHPVAIDAVCPDASHAIEYTPAVVIEGTHDNDIVDATPPVRVGNTHVPDV